MKNKVKTLYVDDNPIKITRGDDGATDIILYGYNGSVSINCYKDWDSKKYDKKLIKELISFANELYDIATIMEVSNNG